MRLKSNKLSGFFKDIFYRFREKPKNKTFIILVVMTSILVATFLTLLFIFILSGNNNYDNDEANEQNNSKVAGENETIYLDDGYVIQRGNKIDLDNEIDLNTAYGNVAFVYMRKMLYTDNNILVGAVDENGEVIPEKAIANIESIAQEKNITDQNLLDLFETEKARVYITSGDMDSAWSIISSLTEKQSTMPDSVKYSYYYAILEYHRVNGNENEVDKIKAEIDELPSESWS